MIRSSERPATHNRRPVCCATQANVCNRATLEANVVTTTRRPFSPATVSSKPSRTAPSDPEALALNTLVESHTSASTPASPIAVSSAGVAGTPTCGASSSFQSPVWNTRPWGVSMTSALPSAIEWASGT